MSKISDIGYLVGKSTWYFCVLALHQFDPKNNVYYRKVARRSITVPVWNSQEMGVGGLQKQFDFIFRRALIWRVMPPNILEEMGN